MKLSDYIKTSCLLFCTLSVLAACQKIDTDDFTEEEQKKAAAAKEKADKEREEAAREEEENKHAIQLQTLDDGTLLLPSDSHVVALESSDGKGRRRVVYVSLYEWEKISSCLNEENPDMAVAIAKKYREGDITGWRIPTKEEARALRGQYNRADDIDSNTYGDALQALNDEILKTGGRKLRVVEKKDGKTAYRYLCDGALYTFSIKTNSKTTKAGKTTLYHLRLVKDSLLNE